MNEKKFNAAMSRLIDVLPVPHTDKEELVKLFEKLFELEPEKEGEEKDE
jgi:hypothetical protein